MKVLFVCMANSCRSQMAEAWARHLCPPDWEIASAGLLTYPISEKTRAVMAEVGLDLAGQEPKTIDRVDLDHFDLIVTLSREAGQYLPQLAHPERHRRHPVADPMSFRGSAAETRADFCRGRDEIRGIVESLLPSP
jgi:arsenate reductase